MNQFTQFQEVIITYTDGRLPYICPNHPSTIDAQQRLNGSVIKEIKPYDPNAKPVVKKPERLYTQEEVEAMLAKAQNQPTPKPISSINEHHYIPPQPAAVKPKNKGGRPPKKNISEN